MKWTIEYGNETGPNDEGFWEWWNVIDGDRVFKCYTENQAQWLADKLNNLKWDE